MSDVFGSIRWAPLHAEARENYSRWYKLEKNALAGCSMCECAAAKYDILLAFSGIDAERRLEYREPSGPGLRHARFAGFRMGRVAS